MPSQCESNACRPIEVDAGRGFPPGLSTVRSCYPSAKSRTGIERRYDVEWATAEIWDSPAKVRYGVLRCFLEYLLRLCPTPSRDRCGHSPWAGNCDEPGARLDFGD